MPIYPPVLPAPAPTAGPREFDFWIGAWEVRGPDGKPAGSSRIESILGGAVIQEHWTGAKGGAGSSFNFVDTPSGQWRQLWVDKNGTSLDLRGGLKDGSMVLAGETPAPKGPQKERITWTPRADGSVRQVWEQSADGGKTWTVAFDGIYTKKK